MKISISTLSLLCFVPCLSYAEKSPIQRQNIEQVNRISKTIYQVNFTALKTIPQGWRIPGNNAGNIYIQDGFLQIDGRSNAMEPTTILLPKELEKLQNYQIDVEFTLDQPSNASRWGGIIYDVIDSQGFIPNQYFQFTLRNQTTAKNGTEFGQRLKNGRWDVQAISKYSENIQNNKIYTASVVVKGNQVQHFLNQKMMQNIELKQTPFKGGIGLSAAGVLMKVKSIQVTEQISTTSPPTNLNQTELNTQVSAPPAIIQKISAHQKLENAYVKQVYFDIDARLNLLDDSKNIVSSLSQYLQQPNRKTIAVLAIKDIQSIEALKQLSKTLNFSDLTLISDDPKLLISAHQHLPSVRTALNLSQMKMNKAKLADLNLIIQLTNQSYAKIVVLPNQLIEKSNVSYIQRRLMTVWADSSAINAQDAATVLSSGVNGIIATHTESFNQILKQFPKNTLLRKPFIIGHRGVPSLEDENTIESAKHAIKLGADIVENDIYITQDHQLVVMHDATVNRTTTGQGKIEEMTLAEVQQLKTKTKNYHVPTLAEYFSEFKKNKNLVLMVEMKSSNPELVPQLKAEIAKYNIADQVVLTSFNRDQIERANKEIPEVSSGILIAILPNQPDASMNAQQILAESQKYSSSYHPPYRGDLVHLFDLTQPNGLTYWPWNLNEQTFKQLYLAGLNGVTTNNIQNYSHYVVDIQAPAAVKLNVGQPFVMNVKLQQQDGKQLKGQTTQFVVLAGSPDHEIKEGKVQFTQLGTAYVLAGYRYQIDAQNSYHIFSSPTKVIIQ